jgi:two-component system NtrC family sensor kinase
MSGSVTPAASAPHVSSISAAFVRRVAASPLLAAKFRSCTALGCAFTAGVAVVVLTGWVLNVERLKVFLYHGPIAMNPLTAIAFLLCAAALWLKHDESLVEGSRRAHAANACAAAAVIAGVLVLLAITGAWDSHVDELLFRDQLRSRPFSNRMAPNTALNFLLVGLALLLLDVESRHGRRPAQILTLTATCVSLLALVGYFLAVLAFYNVPTKVPMALNTSLCFAALCIGTLCARLDREPMATIVSATAGGVVARRLLPAAFGVPLLLGWLRARGQEMGLYDPPMGLSLFALGNIVAFNLLVWWTARLLYRLDERRRVAEERLQQQNALLEQAVRAEREAISALKEAQSQLVQSEKLAGLAQMVAGVAHEINNPLAFASNNAAVLQRDVTALGEIVVLFQRAADAAGPALEASHAELLADLRDRCERLDLAYTLDALPRLAASSRDGLARIKRIVEDLRNFARLDESDLHEVDVNEGIRSTAGLMRTKAGERGVLIELDLAPSLPRVACYPAKINQVVMNLLANAIDVSPVSGMVTVRTAPDGEGGVRIEVTDRGAGIIPEIRGRIFDPFFTTKPVGQGTGLGLSVSYRIIKEHNGSIEVASEPGRGSTFTVRLPRGPQT